MRRLVFATNNAHKLREVRDLLEGYAEILSLNDIGCQVEIPEHGLTLEDNAWAKANYVYCNFGYDCFADDTGLEIDTLGGKPGVRSARYAGEECDAGKNIRKVLEELRDAPDRTARFRTVICLIVEGEEHYFEGVAEGRIIEEKRGAEGFGYDPVFYLPGADQTMAQLPPEVKNRISHRARALRAIIPKMVSAIA